MSPEEQQEQTTSKAETTTKAAATAVESTATPATTTEEAAIKIDANIIEQERQKKLMSAKELYSHGSRNFLIKNYTEAADELSRVCALYAELYGDFADELGMPSLLYGKCLIALSLDENKVLDVPDEADDDDDDDDEDGDGDEEEGVEGGDADTAGGSSEAVSSNTNGNSAGNGVHEHEMNGVDKLQTIKENNNEEEADSTAEIKQKSTRKGGEDALVSSTDDKAAPSTIIDDEKPSTSNGIVNAEDADEDNEAASNLQLAWEIIETAAKIFARQGPSGLANLAEAQTELGNIEFENCQLDAAREDYEKALNIYKNLESSNYRRAMAEIHYKIGLTYLMEQYNQEGAVSLKEACNLIQGEIEEIKAKEDLTEKDKNNIQDMEETKQEIEAKIQEIEEMQSQQIADVRAALDSYIKPILSKEEVKETGGATSSSATSSSAAAISTASASSSSVAKPANDISHLIKRKKPEEPSSEAEAASPAKRPAI